MHTDFLPSALLFLLAALLVWAAVTDLRARIISNKLNAAIALLGGIVTVVTVVHHRWTRRIGAVEIPYGVAIALAGLWVIGEPYFNPSV